MECAACGSELAEGARYCAMCGAPAAPSSQRERRIVSVVFIDLAGFTTLTHGLDPEELRDLADEVLTNVAAVIEEYSGHVDAFHGDGLIAVFGAPRSYADDAERAVSAAAAGLRAIERVGDAKGLQLKGRAGVSTGMVIAGELGSGRVREYTVMGSAVNLAARVEQAATPGEVWVSPATFAATRFRLNYEPSGPVKLAGFPDVNELYVLRSQPEQLSADPYEELPFIGREHELNVLQQAFDRTVSSGRAQVLWLVGDSGIGKSRLLREFLQFRLDRPARVLWPAERSGSSLSWFSLARAVFSPQNEGDVRKPAAGHPPAAEVERQLEELLPDEPRWQRQILASLGLVEAGRWTRLERRRVNRTALAWRDLLVGLSRATGLPLVLVIENSLNDPVMLEFLQLLTEAEAPILLLRSTRSGERADSGEVMRLNPLSVSESLELLNQLADPVMRPATEALVYQVGGVPAYILELGRALRVTEAASISGSLEAVLQARLDRLSPEERRLLTIAALAGERSWQALLLDLGGPSAAEALERLLQERALLALPQSRIPGQEEFRFQSELLRHAVLRMVPYADQPLICLRIATWLESRAPFELSELVAELFRAGGSDEAAWPHYLTALEHAVNERPQQVPGLIERVLQLKLPAEQDMLVALATATAALAVPDRSLARQQLRKAEELADTVQPPQALEKLAELQEQLGTSAD